MRRELVLGTIAAQLMLPWGGCLQSGEVPATIRAIALMVAELVLAAIRHLVIHEPDHGDGTLMAIGIPPFVDLRAVRRVLATLPLFPMRTP